MATNLQHHVIEFPDWYDTRAELEVPLKGWLDGVVVQLEDGSRYKLCFYDPVRLQQTAKDDFGSGQPFFAEANLVIVPEVSTAAIETAVSALVRNRFFDDLKPLLESPESPEQAFSDSTPALAHVDAPGSVQGQERTSSNKGSVDSPTGFMVSFQSSGIYHYRIWNAQITKTEISFLVDEKGYPSDHEAKSYDGHDYTGNYGYQKNKKGENYAVIDSRCTFRLERLGSKGDLLKRMRETGGADPKLQPELDNVTAVPDDSVFLFGSYRDGFSGYSGNMAVVLVTAF
jgi:hypothetical protein